MSEFKIVDGTPVIGGVEFPWAKKVWDRDSRRGCHLMLETGYTLSIIWGEYAYCDNYHGEVKPTSSTAEIAVMQDGLLDCWNNGDTVCGYCTPEFVLAVLDDLGRGDLPTAETLALRTREEVA